MQLFTAHRLLLQMLQHDKHRICVTIAMMLLLLLLVHIIIVSVTIPIERLCRSGYLALLPMQQRPQSMIVHAAHRLHQSASHRHDARATLQRAVAPLHALPVECVRLAAIQREDLTVQLQHRVAADALHEAHAMRRRRWLLFQRLLDERGRDYGDWRRCRGIISNSSWQQIPLLLELPSSISSRTTDTDCKAEELKKRG